MSNLWKWLVTSSADPSRVSLTIRGLLVGIVPFAMLLFGWTQAEADALIEGVVNFAFLAFSLVSSAMTIYGIVRKAKFGRWSSFGSDE